MILQKMRILKKWNLVMGLVIHSSRKMMSCKIGIYLQGYHKISKELKCTINSNKMTLNTIIEFILGLQKNCFKSKNQMGSKVLM